ncbi:MAG: hypothetical protein JWO39_2707, partial [Gemmatimonadetes bacterium]|nr:hypothetical protein [Gemmatimonadota bacterium]
HEIHGCVLDAGLLRERSLHVRLAGCARHPGDGDADLLAMRGCARAGRARTDGRRRHSYLGAPALFTRAG